MSLRLLLLLATLWLGVASPSWAENSSSSIYSDVEASVYQVRVINQQTGKKTAIGSAFVVMRPDIIATNYHVVSTYINNPEGDFALDYLSTSGNTGRLELLAVDVLHDLAVLKADTPLGKPLQIAKIPPKGARLYSLGNPMDKGFSIVEGTNNGVMKSSDDNNILFSGSLNSGMSGGPTLDENKNVVGVNVATSGNGLSYLVPADYLAIILERLKLTGFQADEDIGQRITEQLKSNADKYVQNLQKREWTLQQLGRFKVPMDVTGVVRCWDNSDKPMPDNLMRSYFTQCSNESSIYLDDELEVGTLDYEYVWLDAGEMIPARFYRQYESVNVSVSASGAGKQDVTNFECFTDFTLIAGQEFKMTVCRRDYLNYIGLSDLLVTAALVGHKRQGMLFNLDMTGTTFESGMALLQRMLGDFKWQP
ncbi:Trypsin-like peptidase domain-containing protein [Thiothrix caldifontis]|uniref:Trypsin-like peptidase domain-containing protein n=1 Tax=Thiothrix caldifontis TaxID=525918 RepID=A0A1H3WCE6_9GAMM|nr:serine protease [Thiothrix caldifontis]SDZ84793.1 Trypsin-like peptidase domain-containing protein [Thiothrix caldifontis]